MLVAEKIDPTDPWIYLWRAAAFAQKHSWLQRNAGTPDELAAARKEALDAVRQVVEHSPGYNSDVRVFMREIFHPATEKSDPRENDLEVFKADTEFAGAFTKESRQAEPARG